MKKKYILTILLTMVIGGGILFAMGITQLEQMFYVFVGFGAGLAVAIWGYLRKKQSSALPKGTIKWFNPTKGFGFIAQDFGEDLFFHRTEVLDADFRSLNKDDRVQFEVAQGKKGLVAKSVRKIATTREA